VGTLSDPALKTVSEATFVCWVKRNGAQANYKGLFAKRPLSDGFYLNTDDTLNYSWNDAGDTWGFNSQLIPPDNEWALAALVVQPDKATFYLQSASGGFSSAVNSVTHNPADFTSGPFAIGNDINFAGTTRYFNGAIDEAALFTKAVGEGRIRTYFLVAMGSNNVAPVLVTDPPIVSPAGTIYSTTTFKLSVDAYGSETMTYQWRKDGNTIPGATASTYVKDNASTSDSGGYDVVVANGAGSVTSQIATIAVNAAVPPTIEIGPTAQTRYAGGRAAFTVTASGTTPFQYQWKKNNANIPNATNASLVISPVTSADTGIYSVVVANVAGSAPSASASLTVITPTPDSYEATVVGMGPIAYWRLNEISGSGVARDYVGGYDMTHSASVASGITGPRPPTFPGLEGSNTATDYNGTDGESSSGVSLMNNRAQFTILGWFRPTGPQPASGGRVGLFGQNDVAEFGYHGLGTIGFWTPTGGFASFGSGLVQNNQWYFITATGDGKNLTLYLNGLVVANVAGTVANYGSSSSPFNIGYAVLDTTGNNFLGTIDEVAFFDRALTPAEILLINSKATGLEFKITMQTKHDVIRDTKPSGTPIDGYDNGAVWLPTVADTNSVTRSGVMQFTPEEFTQVVIPWNTAFGSTEGTMTFWMRSAGNTDTNGNSAAMLVDRRTSIGDVIVLEDAGTLFWQPNWIYGQSSASTVNDDIWHHVAYVYDQIATVSLYIDGQLNIDHSDSTVWSWPFNQIELGRSHDGYWRAYDGYMDDFRVYNRKLTAEEIASIYGGESTGVVGAANLVGRYNFDTAPGGTRLELTWPIGVLQSAEAIDGPWADVPNATSPYSVIGPTGSRYFRLKL
jgi:hypothetical protein